MTTECLLYRLQTTGERGSVREGGREKGVAEVERGRLANGGWEGDREREKRKGESGGS